MLIGEISKKTGLSKDTIRFYEKKGLIKVERSTSQFNNYKNYTLQHLYRMQLIIKAKRFGFTLNEISNLLGLIDTKEASCSILQEKVNGKIQDIDRKIQELENQKSTILNSLQFAQSSCSSISRNDNCGMLN